MKNSIAYFVIALWLPFHCVFGQTENFQQKVNATSLVAKVKEVAAISTNSLANNSQSNHYFFNAEVQLQQIGNHNTFNAQIKAKTASIAVLQKGNSNTVTLDKFANSIDQKVIQQGNNNTVYDYGANANFNLKSEFVQKGNYQTIKSYGSNSISQDLKIIQSGNGSSVILINN